MSDLGAPRAPPHPKTMRQTKYLDEGTLYEKKSFFSEIIFRGIFHIFRDLEIWIFMILGSVLAHFHRESNRKL